MTPKNEVKIPTNLYNRILEGINKYRESIKLIPLEVIREGYAAEPFFCPIACSLNDSMENNPAYTILYRKGFASQEDVNSFIGLIDERPDFTIAIPVREGV